MKKSILLSLLIIMTFNSNAQLLDEPQKIIIDQAHNRYLVSNFGSSGDLVMIDHMGNQDFFVENAGLVDALVIVGNIVYGSATSGRIKGFDLDTGANVLDMNLSSEGVTFLSGFAADSSGMIYVSERFGDRIFKIDPITEQYWLFVQGNGLDQPNGMLYEPEYNRILVCLDKVNPSVLAIDLTTAAVTTVVTTTLGGSDGIAKDSDGYYYITGYYLPSIYKFNPDFSGDPEVFHIGSSIVYPTYNATNNSLLVTLYNQNDWEEIPIEENALNNPESVVFDQLYNRYIVSNCGNGRIIQIDNYGQQTYFNTALSYTLGLHINGDRVYVSTNDGEFAGVTGMSLATRGIDFHVDIPEKQLLNDITSDQADNLYITDCDADKIFKVDIVNETYSTYVDSGLGYPNGILHDAPNNRLLVANDLLPNRPINAVSLTDASLSLVVNTDIDAIDGIDTDNDGFTYFSSWSTDTVYRYDQSFTNPPEVVSTGHADPADIHVNKPHNKLVIPNYTSNSIDFIPIADIGINELVNDKLTIKKVYPNPFTEQFSISFSLYQNTHLMLSVYNVFGKCVAELIKEDMQEGDHLLKWNACNAKDEELEPGIYFIKFQADDQLQILKVIKH